MEEPKSQAMTDTIDAFRDGCAWINGQFVPVREARVSIFDAGFTRSDVTYDVVTDYSDLMQLVKG